MTSLKRLGQRAMGTALLAALVLVSPIASAQDDHGPLEGTVLAIDSGDLVIDIGTARGAYDGQVVELWRPMRVRHPVTGKTLNDRFRIGSVRLTQVQGTLSLAKIDGTFLRPPQAGDQVVGEAQQRAAQPNSTEKKPATAAAPSTTSATTAPPPSAQGPRVVAADPEAAALSDLMVALQGSDPDSRVKAYSSFIKARPQSRFAKVLREEIDAIRAGAKREPPYETSFAELERLRPGLPQRFAIELDPRFAGAVVHVRQRGATQYRSIPMENMGARYFATTLPGDAINEPGMEYFVEGVPKAGTPVAIVGSADKPRDAPVDPHPLTGKQPGTLAQVAIASEYASFNAKKANDWMFQTEGTFGWRLRDTGIRAIRSGFGVLRGKGGTLEALDQRNEPPTDVGLTYGYIESEFGITSNFGLVTRPIIGLREGGVTGGAQGFFRVGNDLKTNLLVGGELLGTVGYRGIVQLDWRTIDRVPIMLRSEVTNQPAGFGGDIGARAIAQVGYELAKDFVLAGRLSYQGRTINHAGPGAGLGVSYQW